MNKDLIAAQLGSLSNEKLDETFAAVNVLVRQGLDGRDLRNIVDAISEEVAKREAATDHEGEVYEVTAFDSHTSIIDVVYGKGRPMTLTEARYLLNRAKEVGDGRYFYGLRHI